MAASSYVPVLSVQVELVYGGMTEKPQTLPHPGFFLSCVTAVSEGWESEQQRISCFSVSSAATGIVGLFVERPRTM